MAGVKGMKGSGGLRPGAGRKPAQPVKLDIPVPIVETLAHKDAKMFLMALMNDLEADIKLRADAAKALMPFQHAKVENTIKSDKQEAAKQAGKGRFAAAPAPLRMVK